MYNLSNRFTQLKVAELIKLTRNFIAVEKFEDAEFHFDKINCKDYKDFENILVDITEIKKVIKLHNFKQAEKQLTDLEDRLLKLIFSFKCNLSWFSLKRTIHDNIRFCSTCSRNVYKIENEFDLKKHIQANDCIFYLGEIETEKSCHIKKWGEPIDEKPFQKGLLPDVDLVISKGSMGTPMPEYKTYSDDDDTLPF